MLKLLDMVSARPNVGCSKQEQKYHIACLRLTLCLEGKRRMENNIMKRIFKGYSNSTLFARLVGKNWIVITREFPFHSSKSKHNFTYQTLLNFMISISNPSSYIWKIQTQPKHAHLCINRIEWVGSDQVNLNLSKFKD